MTIKISDHNSPSLEGKYTEHGSSHGGERWALAEFVCGTKSWRHRDGEGLVRSMVAGGLSSRGVCLWHGVVTSSRWRGTGAEHGGGERWALAEFVCGTESWRHRDGEGLVRSMVAGRAELSRSLFVARSRDVIGMERDWCGAWWRGGLRSRGVCLWHGVVTSSGCGIGATFVSTRKSGGKSRHFL